MDIWSFFIVGWLFSIIFKLEGNGLEDVHVFVFVFGVGSESDLVLFIGGVLVVLESEHFLLIVFGIVVVFWGLSFLFDGNENTQIAFVALILEKFGVEDFWVRDWAVHTGLFVSVERDWGLYALVQGFGLFGGFGFWFDFRFGIVWGLFWFGLLRLGLLGFGLDFWLRLFLLGRSGRLGLCLMGMLIFLIFAFIWIIWDFIGFELKRMIEEIELLLDEFDLVFEFKVLGLGLGLGLVEFLFMFFLFSFDFFQLFFEFIKFLISFSQKLLIIFFHAPDHLFITFLLFRGFYFCG
jgi:hypothetical protein